MTVVQRSPNLGINIRLQRLAAPVAAPVPPAVKPDPAKALKPPYWWGWGSEGGNVGDRTTELTTVWEELTAVGYDPGLWIAKVEDTVSVVWQVVFTPMVWFNGAPSGDVEVLAWTGDPTAFQSPPERPEDVSFYPPYAALPDPLVVGVTSMSFGHYWAGDLTSVPLSVGAGNTLSVRLEKGSPSGLLVATAFVGGAKLGEVSLLIKRVCVAGFPI